jgi:tetratricopeptide (TPR) repeat protein
MLKSFANLVALGFFASACMSSAAELESRIQTVERANEPAKLARAGDAFAAVGDYTRAEQYYNLAVENGSNELELVPRLIRVCVRDQRYRDAIQYSEQHLRKYPRNDGVRFLLASLELGVGDTERAKGNLERVLEARPNHADAHYTLAVLLRDDLADFSAADRHFRAYLRLEPRGNHAEEARGSLLTELQ